MTDTNFHGTAALADDPHKVALWFVVEGVLLTILGFVAAALPAIAGLAAALVFAWVLIFSGIVGLAALFASRGNAHPAWSAVSALAAVIAGALVIWQPLAGVVSLALLIAAYLTVDAVASIALGLDLRRRAARGWGWLILTGIADLFLAGFIILLHPLADAVLLGFVVGVDLFIGGLSLIGLGVTARHAV